MHCTIIQTQWRFSAKTRLTHWRLLYIIRFMPFDCFLWHKSRATPLTEFTMPAGPCELDQDVPHCAQPQPLADNSGMNDAAVCIMFYFKYQKDFKCSTTCRNGRAKPLDLNVDIALFKQNIWHARNTKVISSLFMHHVFLHNKGHAVCCATHSIIMVRSKNEYVGLANNSFQLCLG